MNKLRVNHHITRIEYPGMARAWWVRIYRKRRLTARSFPDLKHGGKRRALRLARAWRDELLAKLGPGPRGGVPTALGYGYVRYVERKARVNVHRYCEAYIRVGHRKWRMTKRSVEKHGRDEARRQCEQWLREQRRELGVRRVGALERSVGMRVRTVRREAA